MNIMVALPGERYYAIPTEVLERYAVSAEDFESEVQRKWRAEDTVFHSDVEGQSMAGSQWLAGLQSSVLDPDPDPAPTPRPRPSGSAVMGVRG